MATLKNASKASQDWDARAAQEVAAALARGANVGALVEKKQQRADFLRSKAERTKDQAAQAEVPSQHTSAFSGVAPVPSPTERGNAHWVWCFPVVKILRLHLFHVWLLLLLELTTQGSSRSLQLFCRMHPQLQGFTIKCRVRIQTELT